MSDQPIKNPPPKEKPTILPKEPTGPGKPKEPEINPGVEPIPTLPPVEIPSPPALHRIHDDVDDRM